MDGFGGGKWLWFISEESDFKNPILMKINGWGGMKEELVQSTAFEPELYATRSKNTFLLLTQGTPMIKRTFLEALKIC